MQLEIFASTNDGRIRPHNEDNYSVVAHNWSAQNKIIQVDNSTGVLLIVADGMGGTNAGEVASQIATETISNCYKSLLQIPKNDDERLSLLKRFILQAHQEIIKEGKRNPESAGMGTTAVISLIIDNKAYIAWSGDSRFYLFREESGLKPMTDDHSWVWEEVLKGTLTPEQARVHEKSNYILQSLGDANEPPKPSALTIQLQNKDRFFLCSDGLNSMLPDSHIEQIIADKSLDTTKLCRNLIESANNAGGHDNITVIVCEVSSDINKAELPIELPQKRKSSAKVILISSFALLVFILVGAYLLYPSFFKHTNKETETYISEPELNSIKRNYFLLAKSVRSNGQVNNNFTLLKKLIQSKYIIQENNFLPIGDKTFTTKEQDSILVISDRSWQEVSNYRQAGATKAKPPTLSVVKSDTSSNLSKQQKEKLKVLLKKYSNLRFQVQSIGKNPSCGKEELKNLFKKYDILIYEPPTGGADWGITFKITSKMIPDKEFDKYDLLFCKTPCGLKREDLDKVN